jgi:hypothetical protein
MHGWAFKLKPHTLISFILSLLFLKEINNLLSDPNYFEQKRLKTCRLRAQMLTT